MSNKVTTPYPLFSDIDGSPLNAGFLFLGESEKDAEQFPISVYWDEAKTELAEQPISTRNGFIVRENLPAKIYIEETSCSITIKNRNGTTVQVVGSYDQLSTARGVKATLDAEQARAEAAEIALDNAISNEITRATTAETGLQTQLNAQGGGTYGFNTYAAFDAVKGTLPINSNVNIAEVNNTGTGSWGQGINIWNGTTLTKSPYDPYSLSQGYSDLRERNGLYRNLFNTDEIIGLDLSRITNQAGRNAVSRIAPKTIKVAGTANATTEVRWRFSAAHFKDTNAISASIRLKSVGASVGAAVQAVRLMLYQTTAAGSSIRTDSTLIAGPEAVTVERNVAIENIALDATAVYVEVGFSINAVAARDLVFEDFCISSAAKAAFIRPLANPVNLFPDPHFSGQYSQTFHGIATTENNEQIMTFEVTSLLRQALYQIPAIGQFGPGSIVRFGADVLSDAVNATHMTIVFFDAAGIEITRSTQASRIANSYDTLASEYVVPSNCARVDVRLMKDSNANVGKFKNVFLYSSNQNRVTFSPRFPLTIIHVDAVRGLDTNNGTFTAPLKTFNRATVMAGKHTKIIGAGDFAEAPQITDKIQTLEIHAARNERLRFIGGVKVTGFTQTAGYTKVWQAALATNPVDDLVSRSGYWLYQLGVADTNTLISKRWPQHHGRTYRNPDCTQIWKVASIAAIEAATVPSWFWDAGILYLSCVGFGNPNTADIRIPETITSPFYTSNITKNQSIKLVGVESYFWLNGFRLWDFTHVETIACRAIGNRVNGYETSDNTFVRQVACEGYGNWIDGNGGHVYRENLTKKSCRYEGVDNYFHDNGDDGFSYHEMWAGYTSGMLDEYNGDRGIADAVGSHMVHFNPILYKNGQGLGKWTIDDGAGISCVGTAVDGGISTDSMVFGGISQSNIVNYNVGGSNENVMNLFNTLSIDPVQHHYSAANGTLNLYDARYWGAGTPTYTANGVINVISSLPITPEHTVNSYKP